MIFLDILGRCGNQMFQYAFAKAIAEINSDKIKINFNELQKVYGKFNFQVKKFENELKQFNVVNDYIESNDSIKINIKKYGSISQRLVFKFYTLLRKFYSVLNKNPHIAEKKLRFVLAKYGIYLDCVYWPERPFILQPIKQKNIFIKGYFENPIYFSQIKKKLQYAFTPINFPADKNKEMLMRINNENSICVSFRRWEVNGRDVCDEEYYNKAISYIENHIEKPLFVIFSNDIEWVRKNYKLPINSIFEDGTDTIPEKIRLMSSCKHFIITNSTFCWWTQFLSRNNDKTVISPQKWFYNNNRKFPLIMDQFITL